MAINNGKTKQDPIKNEQELVGTFIKMSVGLYVKQKNNEHIGSANNDQLKEWLKEDFNNLLDGLDHETGKSYSGTIEALKSNLDSYIDTMDSELTKGRDKLLHKEGKANPNSLDKDQALMKYAANSDFIKAANELNNNNRNDFSSPTNEIKINNTWKKIGDVSEKIGIKPLANFFKKKHKQANMQNLENLTKATGIDFVALKAKSVVPNNSADVTPTGKKSQTKKLSVQTLR